MAKSANNRKVSENKEVHVKEEYSAEEKKIEVKKEKKLATVVLSTPLYYVINKDGNNIRIAEKNAYKPGDVIEI